MEIIGFLVRAGASVADPLVAIPCVLASVIIRRLPLAILFAVAWSSVMQLVVYAMGDTRFDLLLPRTVGLVVLSALSWWLANLARRGKLKEN